MIVGLTLLLASLASAGAPETPAAKAPDADGKALFGAKCATCHAKTAKGNPNMAKMYKVDLAAMDLVDATAKLTDADLTKIILAGKGKMPAWKDKLKDAEIAAILGYVRSLTPAKTEASKAAAPAGGQK